MAPKEGGNSRRKSMNILSKGALSGLTPIDTGTNAAKDEDGGDKKEKKRLVKRSSIFGLNSTSSSDLPQEGVMAPVERTSSAKLRPRTLQKGSQKGRPTSIFGSLGRRSYVDESETENLTDTPESPLEDGETPPPEQVRTTSKTVLHHGEVQTSSGLFKKKKEYLVLTETHLVRFKSQSRALETFPSIRNVTARITTARHASNASVGSMPEVQSTISHGSGDRDNKIPLQQIITAYKLEDGKPFFTTEVVYLDEDYHSVGSIQLMLHDPADADLWHTSIRGAAERARLLMTEAYPPRVVQYLVESLDMTEDYDDEHFKVYRVVRRGSVPKGNKSSSDDLDKLGSSVFFLVIGLNRLHLIPLPHFADHNSRVSSSRGHKHSFGLVSLVGISVQYADDRFVLSFRLPLQPVKVLELAGPSNPDIAVVIVQALHFVKPLWMDYTYAIHGPKGFVQGIQLPIFEDEKVEYGNFDRTLVAYCRAYNCNPANIRYWVDWEVEDAPEWQLYSPAMTPKYTMYELLAIMRALRYNEIFRSISFRDIDLHILHGVVDANGNDHVAYSTRAGLPIQEFWNINPSGKSLLYQEIQAIALKSRRLRRMDFTNTLPARRPIETFDLDAENSEKNKDPGCEILAGLAQPLRALQTNVDWITMNGIELGETDLDELLSAFYDPKARIRALECSNCGLNDRLINRLMSQLERQFASLECLNISGNSGRLNIDRFQPSIGRFTHLRKLNISRTSWTSSDQSLFPPEIMLTWKLEELSLSGIPVNPATIDCISTYLASDISNSLRILRLEQCGLTDSDVAVLMISMSRAAGTARELRLEVSANRFEKGLDEVVRAIEQNHTPSELVMRMVEFSKESHFKELLDALRTNTTIRMLDISKASLPYDAGPETCDALRLVFAENTSLVELDISGEHAHLEVTRFGIGLNHALMGLKENHTLKVLRIEYQNLGLEGANTLSTVIEVNKGLTHIYCEHNDISLQGFTTLVNAVARNCVLQEVPYMQNDQGESMKRVRSDNTKDPRKTANGGRNSHHMPTSVRRTLNHLGKSKPAKPQLELTPQDVDEVVKVLEEKWYVEIGRLQQFLNRNRKIAAGVEGFDIDAEGMLSEETMRPTTAVSDNTILKQVLSNTTPRVELGNPVDTYVSNKTGGLNLERGANVEGVEGGLQEGNEKFTPRYDDGNVSTPTRKNPRPQSDTDDDILPILDIAKHMKFELEDNDGFFDLQH